VLGHTVTRAVAPIPAERRINMKTIILLLTDETKDEIDRSAIKSYLESEAVQSLIVPLPKDSREILAVSNLVKYGGFDSCMLVCSSDSDVVQSLKKALRLHPWACAILPIDALFGRLPSDQSLEAAKLCILVVASKLAASDVTKLAFKNIGQATEAISRRELLSSFRRSFRTASSTPIILQDRCASRLKADGYCVNSCRYHAISRQGVTITLSEERCVVCGACATDCPVGAIQLPGASDPELLSTIVAASTFEGGIDRITLLFACPEGMGDMTSSLAAAGSLKPGIIPITVPCVSAVNDSVLLSASAAGLGVALICTNENCQRHSPIALLREHVLAVSRFLSPEEDAPTLLFHQANEGEELAGTLVRFHDGLRQRRRRISLTVNDRRKALLKSFESAVDGRKPLEIEAELPFFSLDIDHNRCTLCGACVTWCSSKALSLARYNGELAICCDSSLCVGCLDCQVLCPEHAISVHRATVPDEVLERKPVPKIAGKMLRCEMCGAMLFPSTMVSHIKDKVSGWNSPILTDSLYLCSTCRRKRIAKTMY